MKLEDVRDIYNRFYEIQNTERIDLLLSLIVSNKLPGRRVWMLFVGKSGIGKTVLTDPIEYVKINGKEITIKSDQITANTLTSGMSGVSGLAKQLDGKIWYFPDFSTILGKKSDTKRQLFSQFRTLYDGFVRKQTGGVGDKEKIKADCTFISNVTEAFHDQILVHNILGTRFLMYKIEVPNEKIREEILNRVLEEREDINIPRHIGEAITQFLSDRNIHTTSLSEERKEWIKDQAKRIAELRATAKSNRYTGGLTSQVYKEFPSRLCKQLRQLWISFMNLKDDYPEERAESIINQIARSCGDPIRLRVRDYMRENNSEWMSISEVARGLNLGKKTVYSDLQMLAAMDKLEREERMRSGNEAECFKWMMEQEDGYEVEEEDNVSVEEVKTVVERVEDFVRENGEVSFSDIKDVFEFDEHFVRKEILSESKLLMETSDGVKWGGG